MLDLAHRPELDWLAQLIGEMQQALPTTELLIVGALARDLLLHYGHGVPVQRITQDADFAVAVADWAAFDRARGALLAQGRFTAHRHALHRLAHATHGFIDLIPFGALERPDGSIAWPPAGDEVMEVIGYAEAAAAALDVRLPRGQMTRTVSLPTLALLKLLAWHDRHRTTQGKDAVDLALVMRHYLDAGNLQRLHAEHPQVINDRFDFERTSAWLLGRDARATLKLHSLRFDQVTARIDSILERELSPDRHSVLLEQLNPLNPDAALLWVTAYRAGLSGLELE